MAEDRWVEPRARIPLAGIVAMVLIVAVVAVFLKTQLTQLFPTAASPTITGADDGANVAGRASASFEGVRDITLARKERLHGVLSSTGGALVATVDVPARLLVLSREGNTQEVLLGPGEEGTLTATFTSDGALVRVDVDPVARTIAYAKPGVSAHPVIIPLGELLTYEGFFTYRSEQLLFQYRPGDGAARISGRDVSTVPLTAVPDGTYEGMWVRDRVQHPVRVDPNALRATVSDVW